MSNWIFVNCNGINFYDYQKHLSLLCLKYFLRVKIRNYIFAVASVIFLMITITSYGMLAQEGYAVKTFTTDQGLPHNHIRGLAQDKDGFLWIASWDGLSRWDGYEFKNYYHNPADTTSLIYFQADNVFVDGQNNVWILTIHGISKYNRAQDNFTSYRVGTSVKIALDRDGNLWYKSDSGFWRWNEKGNSFVRILVKMDKRLDEQDKSQNLYISFDNENHLWISCTDTERIHIYRCNKDADDRYKAILIGYFETAKISKYLNYYGLDFHPVTLNNQDYWIQANNWTFRFDPKSGQFLFNPGIQKEAELAGLKPEEILKIKQNQEYFKPIIRDIGMNRGINPAYVENYLIDRQNTLWQGINSLGTSNGGLTRSTPTSKGFNHYFLDQNPKTGMNAIFPVLKDQLGTVWGGPANVNKLFRTNKAGQTNELIPFDENTWKAVRQPRSFLQDSLGIWIGYFANLLLRYDFKTNQFLKQVFKTQDKNDRSLPFVLLRLKKEGDDIYIFGFNEIYKFNFKTLETEHLKSLRFENNLNFYSVIKDEHNGWWIGGNYSALIHLDNKFNEIGTYEIGLGWYNLEDIIQGDHNDFWISRLGGGLAHFDIATGKSRIYTSVDGLSNNTCYGLLKDKSGNIWISTNHGISRFNPLKEQFRVFRQEDGLKIDEFNSDNTFLAPDGEMFFGGMGGVVSFYPDSLTDNKAGLSAPHLVIEDFKVSGVNRYFSKSIYESDTVVLTKGDNNFQLTFASLDFKNAEKINYRYRLNNLDNTFVQTDFRHRFLNYTNLSPGNYHLEIEATNRDGEWASHASLMIIIPAFYYQMWWFRLSLVFIIFLIIVYFIFSYNQRIRMLARKKQDELRLESLRGQMNPHFIFNSLNSINYFISQNDRLSANRYIADFARLIRTFLGNLSKEFIPFESELESLKDYLQLEYLRFGDKFDYKIEISEGMNTDRLLIFPGMVQPFIENAVWHGVRGAANRKGIVIITFLPGSDHSHFIQCIVEDDGIGRKLSEERKNHEPGKRSRGIGIVIERLRIINQIRKSNLKLTIEDLYPDREETGTRVTIEIPKGENEGK